MLDLFLAEVQPDLLLHDLLVLDYNLLLESDFVGLCELKRHGVDLLLLEIEVLLDLDCFELFALLSESLI